jgi:hypothetical protein
MTTDPRRRQRKLEARAARRKEKHRFLRREKNASLADRFKDASRFPVLSSWVIEDLWTHGLGQVCLSRLLPNDTVAFAVFLVDRYCLGVKNCFGEITTRARFEERVEERVRLSYSVRRLAPASVRKLVEGSVEYARDLGFAPHSDYHPLAPIFGTIDSAESPDTFEFGADGKPFFIAGPNDTPLRCHMILKALKRRCGTDGFRFLIRGEEIVEEYV